MANYHPPYDSTLNHQGENNAAAQSGASCHSAQDIQGAMDDTLAHAQPAKTPAVNEAGEDMGAEHKNNHGLEKHAAKERHKAFMCTCGTKFVRLATLNRHIAAQAGPKHQCTYCDGNRGFAREDKLIDHLRVSHKFGENAIAQFRSQARAQPKVNGHTSSTVATPGAGLPVSTFAGCDAAPGGIGAQAGYSAGPAAGPAGIFDGSLADFPMFSTAEFQPSAPVEDYSWLGAAEDFAGFDFSGIDFSSVDFADFDGNMDF